MTAQIYKPKMLNTLWNDTERETPGVLQLKIARQGIYRRKTEARSRNYCCSVKVIKYYMF